VSRIPSDPRVAAATLTGSEGAGSSVASTAGHSIKKTVLELGGSDPFIVMPSADVPLAADTAVRARIINSGQSCIAAKRFIVHRAIADDFEQRFVSAMANLNVGDPMSPDTRVGPLASEQLVRELERQVQATVRAGARVLTGGRRLDRPGWFYAPTVLTDIPPDSPAYRDELFGPVASLFRVANVDDAIRVANDTRFGLASSAWSRDAGEIDRFAAELEAGTVFVNGMVASDPRFPFGGIKASGYGRELGAYGLREFTNVKTVRIKLGGDPGAIEAAD
jgi:succinate-semialdehyde dehydrogenase / glutarate-semialdehyde dehydrogenase